jgi:acetyl-CoA acetyltransferase
MSWPRPASGGIERPYGPGRPALQAFPGAPTLFTIPVLRSMKTYGLAREQLAMVSVVQREWAAKNPRATFKAPTPPAPHAGA